MRHLAICLMLCALACFESRLYGQACVPNKVKAGPVGGPANDYPSVEKAVKAAKWLSGHVYVT